MGNGVYPIPEFSGYELKHTGRAGGRAATPLPQSLPRMPGTFCRHTLNVTE